MGIPRCAHLLALCVMILAGLGAPPALSAPTLQPPRSLTVLVGAGQDTSQVLAFFPQSVRVRQGDTITWRLSGDEVHTTAFVAGTAADKATGGIQDPLGPGGQTIPGFAAPIPGGGPTDVMLHPQLAFPTRAPGAPIESYSGSGFLNSGVLLKQPLEPGAAPNDTFSVTFPAAGTFPYVCLVHPNYMIGTVEVVPPGADAPDQEAIDARARAEIAPMLGMLDEARLQAQMFARSEPGPNGSSLWFVRAGTNEVHSGDARGQVMDFLPKDLTVRAGDTVVWGSGYFHTVTFAPTPPLPEFFIIRPQPNGPPQLVLNPQVILPAKPSPIFDPTQYFNSADIGPFSPAGFSWALGFETPGTFEYVCLVHPDLGMKGTVTVLAR